MISSICFIDDAKMILSCDGNDFSVIGKSEIANSIRRMSKDDESVFTMLKKRLGKSFDPVRYWYESSMNFADSTPPVEYSAENLRLANKYLSEAE